MEYNNVHISFSISNHQCLPSIASTVMVVESVWRSVLRVSLSQWTPVGDANWSILGASWLLVSAVSHLICWPGSSSPSSNLLTTAAIHCRVRNSTR
jgi:hypothetical protein